MLFTREDGFHIGRVFYRLKHKILLESVTEGDGKLVLVAFLSDPDFCPVIHRNVIIGKDQPPLPYSDSKATFVAHVHFVKTSYFHDQKEDCVRQQEYQKKDSPKDVIDHKNILQAMANSIAFRRGTPVPKELADLKLFVVQAQKFQSSHEMTLSDVLQLLSRRTISSLAVEIFGDANIGIGEMVDANYRAATVDDFGRFTRRTYYHSIFFHARKGFLSDFGENMKKYKKVERRAQALPAEMFLPEIKLISIN